MIITQIYADILISLAQYRYLALPHIMRLRGVKSDKETRKALKELATAKIVGCQPFPPYAGLGRLSSCYWLTSKGAQVYFEELGNGNKASFAKNPDMKISGMPHRYFLLDIMVSLDLWARATGQKIERWGTYFERDATHLKGLKIKPDGLIILKGKDGISRPYLIEACRTKNGGNLQHAKKTVSNYLQLLTSFGGDTFDKAIWGNDENNPYESSSRFLFCFDDESNMQSVKQWLLKNHGGIQISHFSEQFLFKTKENIPLFAQDWVMLNSQKKTLSDGL